MAIAVSDALLLNRTAAGREPQCAVSNPGEIAVRNRSRAASRALLS